MKRVPFHTTPEALLEYLERVEGVDVDGARQDMLRRVDFAADHEGASGVIFGGFKYRLKGLLITSVRPAHGPSIRTGGRRR